MNFYLKYKKIKFLSDFRFMDNESKPNQEENQNSDQNNEKIDYQYLISRLKSIKKSITLLESDLNVE